MKLSEVLKEDWPQKRPIEESLKYMTKYDEDSGFNCALMQCDREIDKEALIKELEQYVYVIGAKEMADHIISTMPTWLKRSDK